MNDYQIWAAEHPDAALDLERVFTGGVVPVKPAVQEGSEAAAQQQARLSIAKQGAMAWRNNVGATPARCPDCGVQQQPTRYGLANDSRKLNEQIKSSDLILAIPRLIGPEHVGTTIAQFGSVECKRPGWHYTGKGQEPGQMAWLALIQRLGGFATFATGEVTL